jgi:tetratricopeptide (TPR) repeat protein
MDGSDNNMILYRPVSLQELELIYDSGMKAFPARLPKQPIFYPVLDLEYARQTASKWNSKNGEFAGYVTQFKVEDEYIGRFEKHTVGKSNHQELWIPAEELEEFNKHIQGHIKVIEAYFGESFQGHVPEKFGLQGKNAVAQFTELANTFVYKRIEFYLEIKRNHKAVFLNYPFWLNHEFKNQGLKEKVLQGIKEAWLSSFPKIPLPVPVQEDVSPGKQTDSPASVVSEFKEPPPIKPVRPRSTANPVNQVPPPRKQAGSVSFEHPEHKESPAVRPAPQHSSSNNIPKNTPPVKQPESQPPLNPARENTPPAKSIVSHFSQGVELGLLGKYQEAVEELAQSVNGNPRHVAAQTSLGVAFRRLGQEDRALSCYETALKINPKSAEAHYFRANILYGQGNVREAITEYTLAIGLEPQLIEAHRIPTPQDRLTDYTDIPAGVYQIARHAFRILDLNKSLEADTQQANLFKERASEYSRLGNYEQAIKDYNSSLALQPGDAAALHSRGLAYEQIGESDRAQKDYKQATTVDPQLSDEYINRGVKFGENGQFRQSIANLTEGIRLAPGNPNGYFNRGATYIQISDFEKAIADFSMVIQLASSDADAYYWRAISREEAGHQHEAISDYRQFLVLSKDPRAREEIEHKLRQWEEEKPGNMSNKIAVRDDMEKTEQVRFERPERQFDLYDLISTLGERGLLSIWFGSNVDCEGEKAEELYAFTDPNKAIEGYVLLDITFGIQRTFEGDFQACDPGTDSPWIFIRAWQGSGFYVETNDPKIIKLLKTQFQEVEEVEGASPPYESLFIRT